MKTKIHFVNSKIMRGVTGAYGYNIVMDGMCVYHPTTHSWAIFICKIRLNSMSKLLTVMYHEIVEMLFTYLHKYRYRIYPLRLLGYLIHFPPICGVDDKRVMERWLSYKWWMNDYSKMT